MTAADPAGAVAERLAALPERLRAEALDALRRAGEALAEATRGRLRQSGGPEPSQPGEPPRDAAGRLAASLVVTLDEPAARVAVTATSPLAHWLEYGTRTMAPRPFLRPAAADVRPDAADQCRQALARAARSLKDGP